MRIAVHDYPGHAFPLQLSRELARRGHEVLHLHFPGFQSPKGPLAPRPDDPPGLAIEAVSLGEPFRKFSFVRRRFQEVAYGRRLAARVLSFRPEVALSNGPLDPHRLLARACRVAGARHVVWLQDLYGVAIDRVLRRRLPLLGHAIGLVYRRMERRLLRGADAVVCITDDFVDLLTTWGIARERCHVIPNWAPLDDLGPVARDSAFARAHGLTDGTVALYAGTLSLKHNPGFLLALAHVLHDRPATRVVVVSEGPGRAWLEAERARAGLDNLVLADFQPHERLAEILCAGDLLLAFIERDAASFSVPSKVSTYIAAGRPVLLAAPGENLAARMVEEAGAGRVVAPDDPTLFATVAKTLLDDPAVLRKMGENARKYAETKFDIARIASRFEAALGAA